MTRRKRLAMLAVASLVAAVSGAAAWADNDGNGFRTTTKPMLTCPSCGTNIVPLLTVGDDLPGGYQFEAIPDGISIHVRGNEGDDDGDGGGGNQDDVDGTGLVDLYVNHETSTVPFPFSGTPVTPHTHQNDFDNSQLSRLRFDAQTMSVLKAKMVITSDQNFQRFCSNYLATKKEGFDRPILFTSEEAQDVVRRSGTAWETPGIPLNLPGAEQPGVVVAYDVKSGEHRKIYGMGRLDHENSTAVPTDAEKVVLLTGDDTFMTAPVPERATAAWSQLYSYIADDADGVWRDEGDLWAFVSDNAEYQNYYDFGPGDRTSVSGHFVKVPKHVATGKKADGTELTSADFASTNMLPPPAAPSAPPDGPQWVLDQWGNPQHNTAGPNGTGANVFRFVRVEDVAYDKRPGMGNVVYIADSGLGSSGAAPVDRKSTNGRIWRMELDKNDPTKVISLRVLVEGDDQPVKTRNEIHQPDNVETTANGSLLIQEDPGSSQQFIVGDRGLPNARTAGIWKVSLSAGSPEAIDASRGTEPVALVDQSLDENTDPTKGAIDVDPPDLNIGSATPLSPGRWGAWESSGIVDASAVLGPGWFFVDVQAHTYWIEMAPGPGFTYKREGGQLLAIRIPGA